MALSLLAVLINLLLWWIQTAGLLLRLKPLGSVIPDMGGGMLLMLGQIEVFLSTPGWTIPPECALLSAGVVFIVFVLAFPARILVKQNLLLFGVPLLLVATLIRWLSLLWAGNLALWENNFFFDYLGLVTFVLLVALVWFVATERKTADER